MKLVYFTFFIFSLMLGIAPNLMAQPANDTPENAVNLDGLIGSVAAQGWFCDATPRTYSTVGSNPTACAVDADLTAPNSGAIDCDAGTINDVWFSFTGGPNVWLDFYTHQTNNVSLAVALYEGTPTTSTTPSCSVGGLTFVACVNRSLVDNNNTDSGGTDRNKGRCTSPTHSRVDLSGLTASTTYYARVWHDGISVPLEGQFYVCVENTTPPSPGVDKCTAITSPAAEFGCAEASPEGRDVNVIYQNLSNAGCTGNSNIDQLCDPDNGVLALGAASTVSADIDSNCDGGTTFTAYLNNVVNNNVMYSFEVDACSPSFLATATLTFQNMEVCCGGGSLQIQVLGPLAGDATDIDACRTSNPVVAAFNANPDNLPNNCISVMNNTVAMNGTFVVIVDGQNGLLNKFDMQLEIDYAGCPAPEPDPCMISHNGGLLQPILPVELIHFDGKIDRGANLLTWATATEINNDYFTIERSADGEKFEELIQVTGKGNSLEESRYVYYDSSPLPVSYYRLKQTDFDGRFTYSSIIHVKRINDEVIINNLYPIPTKKELTVEFDTPDSGVVVLSIHDIFGKNLLTQTVDVEKGNNAQALNLESISQGLYFITIEQNNQRVIKRFTKE